MHIVSADELSRLLTMSDVIELMRDAFIERGAGRADIPDRTVMTMPGTRDTVLVMPGAFPARRAVGVKVVSVFPDNPSRQGMPVITATVLFMHPDRGEVALALDGTWVTAMRTGAVTGLSTDLLARPDATHLVVFGTGPQAATQVEAVCAVRPIRRVTVCATSSAKADLFVTSQAGRYTDARWEAARGLDDAIRDADVVVTATSSRTPVFDGHHLPAGVHVAAIGAFTPDARELDTTTITRGRVYVDDRQHAWREAGDLRIPESEGVFAERDIVGDLGMLLSGACAGRADDQQITVFKSVGLAIEDVAVAARVWASRS